MSAGGVYISNDNLLIAVSSEEPNLRNYWSGMWFSTWTVSFVNSKVSITGDIKVYYSSHPTVLLLYNILYLFA